MKHLVTFISMFIFSLGLNAQDIGSKDIENKVKKLISELTLEEKASLCSGRDPWSTKPIERLNIPWIWMADGPHGVRRAPSTDKWGYGDQHPATCFPTASALAATWDTELIYKVGQALGGECQSLGVNVLLGPGVNIKRSVLGGRNFEFFSEDPILSGELGAAFINGVQSQGVGTSLKHYVANNVETNRMHINSAVDTRTLHEIYLHPFEIAVKKAQPWTVMACYNRVQGVYGTESPYLLTGILKNRWGFEGIVISDWEAVVDRVEGIRSGMHIQMPGHTNTVTDRQIVEAVNNGSLDESKLDQIVKDILTVVLTAKSGQKEGLELNVEGNHDFARQVAAESITLLKNEKNILPINTSKYKTVAIIGEFAKNPRYQGNGSSEVKPSKLDETLEVIKREHGQNIQINYTRGYDLKDDDDFSMINEAKNMAKEADIALVFAGLPLHYESEGIDRKHIDLPVSHNKLISEVASVQKNTVVVLTNGSAVAMPWVDYVNGILETWLPGQAGAGAIGDVLFGNVNPSGKIAETFPVKLEDSPAFINFPGEEGDVFYGERMFVGYRHYDKRKIKPLFPFGHGLSYTTFEYLDLKVSSENPTDSEGLKVSCIIKNTGKVKGKEIVQLYISDPVCKLQRPVNELKKFKKVELNPGESKAVEFNLDSRDFSYFNSTIEKWIAESGEFVVSIGASSADKRLSKSIDLISTQNIPLGFDEYTFFREYWNNPQTRVLLKELVPNWIKFFTPEGKTADEAQFQDFLIDQPMIKFTYLSQGEVTESQIMEFVERCKEFTRTP